MNASKTKYTLSLVEKYLFLTSFALVSLFPLVWMLLNSFRNSTEILSDPFGLPTSLDAINYYTVWVKGNMSSGFLNSLYVSLISVMLLIFVATIAAYALARMRDNLFLYAFFSLGIMIPAQAILIPNFQILRFLGLYNSHPGLILIYVTNNLTLAFFISYAFLRPLPKELEESAFLDGASRVRAFRSIIFPLTMPAISTFAILAFLNCWNDYLMASIFITEKKMYTITMFIYTMMGEFSTNFGALFAGMGIAVLPVLLIYIFFQEQISKGMTGGAVKG